MPFPISIVGKPKSGKTTLIEKLVQELKSLNYRVTAIKHVHHGINLNESDKDSWQ